MKRIPLISLRMVRDRSVVYHTRHLQNSQAIYELFRQFAEDLDREAMWLACLDTRNHVTCLSQVSLGTINATLAHPREILKIALLSNATSIITVHNHPSGDPEPSRADRDLTLRLKEAAQIVGMGYLDHLIIGDGKYYSFADQGGL